MFYIKENLNDTTSISVEINNENVYCRCPQCGAEVPVDLSVFWTAENFDHFQQCRLLRCLHTEAAERSTA